MVRVTRRGWLILAAAVWAVLLVAAGTYAARHGRPTVREQTSVVKALPVADRAIVAVVTAAAGPDVVAVIEDYEQIDGNCRAGNRDGERWERTVSVYTAPGREGDVVDRVAHGLPASYKAGARHSGPVHTLHADAGYYVRVTGSADAGQPGALVFRADTGCRVLGGPAPRRGPDQAGGTLAGSSAMTALFRLGRTESRREFRHLPCPAGGVMWSVTLFAPKVDRPVSDALPAGRSAFVSRDTLLGYQDGPVGVVVRPRGDEVTATATTSCQ